jgi:omega-6 fatty acid desaturase (delta-12 desaturase)
MFEPNFWREKLVAYTVKSNAIGTRQVLLTLIPFILLWVGYALLVDASIYLFIPFSILVSLFILRSFVLMHDCGHGSLFKSRRANQIFGFVFGVITGMPQFVWSKNHAYHHNTNGDWVKYGGVFNILSTSEYAKLSKGEQRYYWIFRQPLILIPAGFFYVLFNPRFNWLLGNLLMLAKIIRPLLTFQFSEAVRVAKKWETKFWKGKKDYLHMTYNNVALLAIWFIMCKTIGTAEFFCLYAVSTSLAGSVGILLFTIQHNFEDSYATDTARVNSYRAALEGTSMLVLPKVLNWFTADIAYHHLHHLSVAIPNYHLAACHREYESLFVDVKRFRCRDLLSTFKYQLWDKDAQKVVAKESSSIKTAN